MWPPIPKGQGWGGQNRPPGRSVGQASEDAGCSFCKDKLPQREAPGTKGFHREMTGGVCTGPPPRHGHVQLQLACEKPRGLATKTPLSRCSSSMFAFCSQNTHQHLRVPSVPWDAAGGPCCGVSEVRRPGSDPAAGSSVPEAGANSRDRKLLAGWC